MTPEKAAERAEHHLEQATRQRNIKERAEMFELYHHEQYARIEEGYNEQSMREWQREYYG